jgi:solute carrier family 30 (zinc transporter), member 5/7
LLVQTYLRTILASPESRKIFYFLLLNLAFMLVQMLYGVWTNSLGLISDAIHMAFDCMAIAMGLFASVMSGWERNERFTYGYGRVETLSGFANGIFLILISVFIVFEAVQRLFVSFLISAPIETDHSHRLDPPEMNTNQLLLVSSIGLGVNLFGMFAMGGHHHHVRIPSLLQPLCRLPCPRAIRTPMVMATPMMADTDTPFLVQAIVTTTVLTRTRIN